LKLFGTVVRSDAAEKPQSRQFSYWGYLSGMSLPTAAPAIGSSKSQHCRQLALLILESRA